jgi:hypothetical protein
LQLRQACHAAPLLLPRAAKQQCWAHCERLLLHVLFVLLLAQLLLLLAPRLVPKLGQLCLALQSRHHCRCHQQAALLRTVSRQLLPLCAASLVLLLLLVVC